MIFETNEFVVIHNALYFIKTKALVVADIHLGYDESINNEGVLIPLTSTKKVYANLKKIISELEQNTYTIEYIIFNGDIKHDFGSVLKIEDKVFRQLILLTNKYKLIFVKGNHDKILDKYIERLNNDTIITSNFVVLNDTKKYCIAHGDNDLEKLYTLKNDCFLVGLDKEFKKIEFDKFTFVIGHEHPVVELSDNYRTERYKALLISKKIIILPSFNDLVEGVNFNLEFIKSEYLSPLLNEFKVKDYEAYLFHEIDKEIFYFPSLKELI